MRTPSLSAPRIASTCALLLEGADGSIVDEVADLSGSGDPLDLGCIAALADGMEASLLADPPADADRFEGVVGAKLHHALESLGIEVAVLDDPGFWAYLTTRYFWWFAVWRHPVAIRSGAYANYRRYVDGTNPPECVTTRAYLRARIVYEPASEAPYGLATAVPKGADFWRSHVLRVRTGTAPPVAKALVADQAASRMSTDDLRAFAKSLNRTWTNIVPHLYDEEDARLLLEDLHERGE